MSLLNWGGGLSAAGSAVAGFAEKAGVAEQKAELEKQQAVLADSLATTRETKLESQRQQGQKDLVPIQEASQIKVGQSNASAQSTGQIAVQSAANKLPMTAEQTAEDNVRQGTLAETKQHNRADENKPVAAGYNGFMVKDSAAPGGWKQVNENAFTPEMSSLMGALAERGISLPAGFRSRQQQASLIQGLMDRNPGKTPDEIADGIKSGKLQLAADLKQAQTIGGITGKIKYAEEEMPLALQTARDAIGKIPTSSFVPLSKLMVTADENISDPNVRDLKIKLMGALNAYDMLAARAGTDVGKREAAHKMLETADTPEVLNKAIDAFELEATNAKIAAKRAMSFDAKNGQNPNNNPTANPAAPPPAAAVIPSWVKPGDQYSPSRKKARDAQGNEYGESP